MNAYDFQARETEILGRVPQEFRAAISLMAWERGHAYGHNEVLGHVESMVYDLLPSIEAFETRIRNEKQ